MEGCYFKSGQMMLGHTIHDHPYPLCEELCVKFNNSVGGSDSQKTLAIVCYNINPKQQSLGQKQESTVWALEGRSPVLTKFKLHDMLRTTTAVILLSWHVFHQVSHLESHCGSILPFSDKATKLYPHPSFGDFQAIWSWPRPHDPHLEVVEAVVARTLTVADLNLPRA